VLEHVADAELAAVFGHAAAAVHEGGLMVVHELHADLRAEGTRAHFRAGDREHVLPSHAHDARAYEAALAASGWRLERVAPWVATEASCRACVKLAKHLGKPVLLEVEARRVRDHRTIYAEHAGAYEALVAREDHEGNLLAALRAIAPLAGADVVETGAGTGRVSFLLAPHVRSVAAFDREPAMLAVAEARRRTRGIANVRFAEASHRALPVENGAADLAIEGWAFGHAVGWNPGGWRDDVDAHVAELRRVLRPGGTLVLVETMGTGVARPFEGGHALEPFHAHLVERLGFAHRCVRTDYAFDDVDEAAATTGFFFGERMAERVRANGWRIVPEHTGVYWLRA
jgi:SAM-dependent methyltransferase